MRNLKCGLNSKLSLIALGLVITLFLFPIV